MKRIALVAGFILALMLLPVLPVEYKVERMAESSVTVHYLLQGRKWPFKEWHVRTGREVNTHTTPESRVFERVEDLAFQQTKWYPLITVDWDEGLRPLSALPPVRGVGAWVDTGFPIENTMILGLVLFLGAIFASYRAVYRRGIQAGKKALFDTICQPYQEIHKELTGTDGCKYDVRTRFLRQEIVIGPEFEHPFGKDCPMN